MGIVVIGSAMIIVIALAMAPVFNLSATDVAAGTASAVVLAIFIHQDEPVDVEFVGLEPAD